MSKPVILAIQNDPTDPPHLAGRWLMELGFEMKILRAFEGEIVPAKVPDGVAGLMPLGGHMGALDDHIADWLPNERAMLADAVARDIPIFAICLGAQLLAEATGGTVARAEIGEIGIYSIELSAAGESDPILTVDTGALVFRCSHLQQFTWHPALYVQIRSIESVLRPTRFNSTPRSTPALFKIGNHTPITLLSNPASRPSNMRWPLPRPS